MSPEQTTGGARLDGRSDIYSLACVLYEMLAGDPPYVASSAQAVAARQSMDPVPRLRTVREKVPAAVEQVIGQALAKVPADRFATAAAFAEALQAAMTTAASQAAAHRPPARRVVAVVAGVLATFRGVGVWGSARRRAPPARPPPGAGGPPWEPRRPLSAGFSRAVTATGPGT